MSIISARLIKVRTWVNRKEKFLHVFGSNSILLRALVTVRKCFILTPDEGMVFACFEPGGNVFFPLLFVEGKGTKGAFNGHVSSLSVIN